MIAVKATREGLQGSKTASGYLVERHVPFVALPSSAALHLWVRVFNPRTEKRVRALVLDVGPWNVADHSYVFQEATLNGLTVLTGIRPQAESGTDVFGRTTNKAGIDLSEAVWKALGMVNNETVLWEFI